MTVRAIKGKYKDGSVTLDEMPKNIKEAEVVVVFMREKRDKNKILENIKESLVEVKAMREGKMLKKTWWNVRDEI